MTTNHLFVYGTLLSADTGTTGRAQRTRLAREARIISPATLPGRLYDLGRYPALVIDTPAAPPHAQPPPALVQGELLELSDPPRSFLWLDAYEGIVPGNHQHNDYERVQLPVTRPDGAASHAWVYVWRAPLTPSAAQIPGGNWLRR